jgi:hypothetical protein
MAELQIKYEFSSLNVADGKLKDCNKQMLKMNEKLHIYENENLILQSKEL